MVSWLGGITGLDDDALSDSEIIDGGIGDLQVKIRIERMSVDETVGMIVDYAAYSQAKDSLVLSVDQPNSFPFFEPGLGPLGELTFPVFHLDVDPAVVDYEAIEVRISSDQTALEVIEVKSIFADFLAAYE